MELHEKLQILRKQKGLTQEELAGHLYVSRTAVSKWESGRGTPNIESLKAISAFFSVSLDDLLSSNAPLTIDDDQRRQRSAHCLSVVFGLLDCGMALLFVLPLFGQQANGAVQAVSLLTLTTVQPYLKTIFAIAVIGMMTSGAAILASSNIRRAFQMQNIIRLSFLLHAAVILLFIISRQPYAAAFAFSSCVLKGLILAKRP